MKKLLVANRSEIACRIFQSAKELGLHTVGLVAPGDEEARHVTYADEIHPVPSYLDIFSIVEVAQKCGAHLVHPGYGFLSERSQFAKALEGTSSVFIGPRAETMELMGGKISAKDLANREGVPTLPWKKVEPGQSLKDAAMEVGFPILLKASAGGGGKGMRRVNRLQDLTEAAESASAEASAAFGDGTLFIERFVENPRHIEVQVFGNGRGEGVHLYERECSLQRRHQKVWEEAQAPHLSEKARQGLFEAALKLVRATRYRSAGTIEFLVDAHENFYFLEMNTRLQVEHPVTELITGVDLVAAQIQQALNPLNDVLTHVPSPRGHAIEVRLYAEDPAQGFIPTPGKIESLRWPTGTGIRVESGVEAGQTIGTQFDSMIAKLIVFAENREKAIRRMEFALEDTVVLGIGTNQAYLKSIAEHPAVRDGKVHTHFLDQVFGGYTPEMDETDVDSLLHLQAEVKPPQGPSRVGTSAFASPWFERSSYE